MLNYIEMIQGYVNNTELLNYPISIILNDIELRTYFNNIEIIELIPILK